MNRFILLISLLAVSLPLHAQQVDLTLFASHLRSDSTPLHDPARVIEIDFTSDLGFGLSASLRVAPALDVEVSLFRFESDVRSSSQGQTLTVGSVTLEPMTALLRYRFRRDRSWQPYIGTGVGYLPSTAIRLPADGSAVELQHAWSWASAIGFDMAITDRAGIVADARWMQVDLAFRGAHPQTPTLSLDPLMVSLGTRFRF